MAATVVDGMQGGKVSAQAMVHCTVAQGIRHGQSGITRDGHKVLRVSSTEWEVISTPDGSRYPSGAIVPSRVLFFRMNGLEGALQ